ncbi:MAG: RagB/SusD family nutrient uptake outer membrane protein, partial [Muribaculaceae bacterium]|nr:RagB/SusD family nutrient uptake outer membrane protein [Muribaculaceae bacterium]
IDDNGISYRQSMGVNTYMMRLAEVYLNMAEAILGNNDRTSDETALQYFNAVRERAGVAGKSSITWEDLRKERRIELALEGQYWYDLVRRSYYKRNEIVSYLNTQDRNCSYIYDETEKCQYAKNNNGTGVAQATEASLVFPFSDVDLGRNPQLNSAPVAYDFGEREVTHDQLYN